MSCARLSWPFRQLLSACKYITIELSTNLTQLDSPGAERDRRDAASVYFRPGYYKAGRTCI